MIRNLIRYAAVAAAIGLGACSDKSLEVINPNAGETKRVIGNPNDAESLLGTFYKRWSSGVYGSTGNLEGMANIFSLMNYSSLANNCQNSHYPFTGATNFNSPGNTCGGEQSRLYFIMAEVNRVASNILLNMADSGLTLSPPGTNARDLRAKAFAEFLRGISLGYVSLMHDSSAIVSPSMSLAQEDCLPDAFSGVCIGALRGYRQVFDSSMAALQRAIDYANTPATGPQGFPLPAEWIPSPTSFTAQEFVRLIRTYRARIRANVARTPAERAAVDWTAVIADATGGITDDHYVITSTTAGPGNSWRQQYESFSTWHQMPPFIIGMADTSGSYAAWIGQPLSARGGGGSSFTMVTPDLRFPQGSTRGAQQTDFAIASCAGGGQLCRRYFRNRPAGNDQLAGAGWGWSNYDFVRFHSWQLAGDAGSARNGKTLFFTKAELDLLEAEGQFRLGNYTRVAELVNKTRTRGMEARSTADTNKVARGGGLPAISVVPTDLVPGGNACVPKVPVGPNYNTVACGNMWEALKYEKRIETAYTHYVPWYLDGRGWGDLPKDVPIFWAVPYQDLQARGRTLDQLYGAGLGTGNAPNSVAGPSTYGW